MNRFRTRADVRRMLALGPRMKHHELAPAIRETLFGGEKPPMAVEAGVDILRDYLLDPAGGALLAFYPDERAEWFDLPVFTWVGPGNAAPIDDVLAAVVIAPHLLVDEALSPVLIERRFAPRADEAVAQAVAALPASAQAAALRSLWADRGPEPELLAMSLLQCAHVIARAPTLFSSAAETVTEVVDALLARLSVDEPRTLSGGAAHALAGIALAAPAGSPVITRIRDAARAGLAVLEGPIAASFADEVRMLSAAATPDRWGSIEQREIAVSCAYILGALAPRDAETFASARDEIQNHPSSEILGPRFIDGLVAASHLPALISLATTLLGGSAGQVSNALALAARVPLDPLGNALAVHLDSPEPGLRVAACSALEMVISSENLDVDLALASRLSDLQPEVCAAAARALLARDRSDLIARHSALEPNDMRRAIALAAIGEISVPVIGELVTGMMDILDQPELRRGGPSLGIEAQSPVLAIIRDALFCSARGLDSASALLEAVPDAVSVLALAVAPNPLHDYGVLAPPDERAQFARVTLTLAQSAPGTEIASLALYLLSWVSAGDPTIADHIAAELTKVSSTNLLAALGEIRTATPSTAAALVPFLAPTQDLVTRVAATSIAGRVLPADHEAWALVRELLRKGALPKIAAWSALRDRARRTASR